MMNSASDRAVKEPDRCKSCGCQKWEHEAAIVTQAWGTSKQACVCGSCTAWAAEGLVSSPASHNIHPSILWLITQVESKATGLDVEWEAVKALLSTYHTRPELWRAKVSSPARPDEKLCTFCLLGDQTVKKHALCDGWNRHSGIVERCQCYCVAASLATPAPE